MDKFDHQTIQPGSAITIIGKRKSGKSTMCVTLCKTLCYLKSFHQNQVITVSRAEHLNDFYKTNLPLAQSYSKFEIDQIVKFTYGECPKLLIIDEAYYNNRDIVDQLIPILKKNGTIVIVTQQWAKALNSIRHLFDHVFMCNGSMVTERNDLFETHGSRYPSVIDFCHDYNQLQGFDCLVLGSETWIYNSSCDYLKDERIKMQQTIVLLTKLSDRKEWADYHIYQFLNRLPKYAFRTVCQYV